MTALRRHEPPPSSEKMTWAANPLPLRRVIRRHDDAPRADAVADLNRRSRPGGVPPPIAALGLRRDVPRRRPTLAVVGGMRQINFARAFRGSVVQLAAAVIAAVPGHRQQDAPRPRVDNRTGVAASVALVAPDDLRGRPGSARVVRTLEDKVDGPAVAAAVPAAFAKRQQRPLRRGQQRGDAVCMVAVCAGGEHDPLVDAPLLRKSDDRAAGRGECPPCDRHD